jgi:AsmA protein
VSRFRDKLTAIGVVGARRNAAIGPVWNVAMRALKITGAALVAVIVVVALLLVVGIPFGVVSSAIEARVARDTGYRLSIAGATRIGLWPSLNLTLHDVMLQDPNGGDDGGRLSIGSVQADMTFASLWSGHPDITALVINRPELHVPLRRHREPQSAPKPVAASGDTDANALLIHHVTITDGRIILANQQDGFEQHIEGINAEARIGDDRKLDITGSARAGDQPLSLEIKATVPPQAKQNIPVELSVGITGAQPPALTAKAEVRLNGAVVSINGVSGTLGGGAFNGWASVDLASKPLIKIDLDFQQLDIAATGAAAPSPGLQPWSDATLDLRGLNYVDAQIKISAAGLNIGAAHAAPAAIDATLADGIFKCGFPNLGVYDGHASGEATLDVTSGNPVYTLHSDLTDVRALPLLRSVADFDRLDGRLQAKLDLRSAGNSPRAVMSNLHGTASAVFRDGALRGLNIAQMIRSLTSGVLSGWQQADQQSTDLTQLSASVAVANGQATTSDLNLVGPLVRVTGGGAIDLVAKSLALRVEPKLVLTTEGQGRSSDPVGLGIPVIIDGPWAEPRIYPDVSGILQHPEAAYAKLRQLGQGLFGGAPGDSGSNDSGDSNADQSGSRLGQTLHDLVQQGLGQSRTPPPQPPAPGDPPPPQDSQPLNDVLRQLFNR